MADITKCPGVGCDRRDECYRFTAPENPHRQSWFAVTPIMIDEPIPCDYFLDIEKC